MGAAVRAACSPRAADPRDVGRRLLDAARGAATPARANLAGQAEIAIGSRYAAGAKTVKQPGYSRDVEPLVQQGRPALARPTHARAQCRFKAFTAGAAQNLFGSATIDSWAFDLRDPRAGAPPRPRDRGSRRRVEGRRALARESVHRLLEGDSRGADDPPRSRPRRLRDASTLAPVKIGCLGSRGRSQGELGSRDRVAQLFDDRMRRLRRREGRRGQEGDSPAEIGVAREVDGDDDVGAVPALAGYLLDADDVAQGDDDLAVEVGDGNVSSISETNFRSA